MNEQQIKHMVDKFLGWQLPKDFNPDGGITFIPTFNENTDYSMVHKPTGTNLFDARQTEAMVRYLVSGLPTSVEEQ